jgi:hypothetical protein
MINGDSIVGSGWYKEHVIISYPGNDSLYYLFCAGVTPVLGFYYSVINIKGNNGNGILIQKNVPLQNSNFHANDGLIGIKHGNGRDWWVIIRHIDTNNNEFFFYLVNEFGVFLDHIQPIGPLIYTNAFRIESSKLGNKISCISDIGEITVYDFDRCSGILSNEISIDQKINYTDTLPWYWDSEFSPSSQILYVSTANFNDTSYLIQFNLNDTNPNLTRDTLYSINHPVGGGQLKLGPDNKMYWSCNYNPPGIFPYPYPDSVRNMYNENLSVINFPDSLGAACDLQPFSFYLGGKRTYHGLPNNPNYELGPLAGNICDTVNAVHEIEDGGSFLIYPNPSNNDEITISGFKEQPLRIEMLSVEGKKIASWKITDRSHEIYLQLPPIAKGIYYLRVIGAQLNRSKVFIKN